jgi:hypothetical protein
MAGVADEAARAGDVVGTGQASTQNIRSLRISRFPLGFFARRRESVSGQREREKGVICQRSANHVSYSSTSSETS